MLEKNTIDFLKKLKKSNHRDWLEANRTSYEDAKNNFLSIVEKMIQHLSKSDSRYGELQAKQCVFRLHRDIRFSKDKSPYKTNFGASFSIGGKKSHYAGYYLHLDPENSFAGGGIWMPEADMLKKIRQEIDYNADEFLAILKHKTFVNTFGTLHQDDKLKNPPKGYDSENKVIEMLKLKSFTAMKGFTVEDVLNKKFPKEVAKTFDALEPLLSFLNRIYES